MPRCDEQLAPRGMLTLYSDHRVRLGQPTDLVPIPLADVVWIDLMRPDPSEIAFIERATGLAVPGIEELSEIESSSRLRAENGALYLSAPLVYRSHSDDPQGTPVGFILTQQHFITMRFETPTAFTIASANAYPTPHDAFAGVLEA